MADKLSINPGKTAIISMDWQKRQLSNFTEAFQEEIMARANTVLAKTRQKKIMVINVEVRRGERTPETEIHPAMVPQPGEALLTKSRVGPFSTTNLDEILKNKGIETLVLMGLRTSGCILSTVRWAADIDYQLVVISDCCADQDDEVHRVLMEKVLPWQATVVTSQDFLQALDGI